MFTSNDEYQYTKVRFNHTSDTTIQVELQINETKVSKL